MWAQDSSGRCAVLSRWDSRQRGNGTKPFNLAVCHQIDITQSGRVPIDNFRGCAGSNPAVDIMVKTYCVSVLGSNIMDHSLSEIQDIKEFSIQTKLADFHIKKLQDIADDQKVYKV